MTPSQYRNIFIVFGLIIAILAYFIFAPRVKSTHNQVELASESSHSTPTYLAVAEERHKDELEKISDTKLIEKRAAAKKGSLECQFWTQQQAKKTSEKIEEKVAQFCNLDGAKPADGNAQTAAQDSSQTQTSN